MVEYLLNSSVLSARETKRRSWYACCLSPCHTDLKTVFTQARELLDLSYIDQLHCLVPSIGKRGYQYLLTHHRKKTVKATKNDALALCQSAHDFGRTGLLRALMSQLPQEQWARIRQRLITDRTGTAGTKPKTTAESKASVSATSPTAPTITVKSEKVNTVTTRDAEPTALVTPPPNSLALLSFYFKRWQRQAMLTATVQDAIDLDECETTSQGLTPSTSNKNWLVIDSNGAYFDATAYCEYLHALARSDAAESLLIDEIANLLLESNSDQEQIAIADQKLTLLTQIIETLDLGMQRRLSAKLPDFAGDDVSIRSSNTDDDLCRLEQWVEEKRAAQQDSTGLTAENLLLGALVNNGYFSNTDAQVPKDDSGSEKKEFDEFIIVGASDFFR